MIGDLQGTIGREQRLTLRRANDDDALVPRVLATLILLIACRGACGTVGENLRVQLVTFGPGDAPWEKFGHNMLVLRGEQGAIAYNWGMFDFEQKNFIFHFVQGKLWYWMEGFDAGDVIEMYKRDDRTIWQQELNLSPAQRERLYEFCRQNEQPANRFYKYDYFTDNCSTRVRDALDAALDGQIKKRATTMPSGVTFRGETLRLTAGATWLYTGLDFLLGHPVDRPISAWEEMFVPTRQRERLNQMHIVDSAGNDAPLVTEERILHQGGRDHPRAAPPNWIGWFAIFGVGLAAVQFFSLRAAQVRRGWRRVVLMLTALIWPTPAGLAGMILALMWLFTDHAPVRGNENILQLSPVTIVLVVLIPAMLRGWRGMARAAKAAAAVVAGLSLLGLAIKILPMMNQPNAQMIALALPANLALAAALWWPRRVSGNKQ